MPGPTAEVLNEDLKGLRGEVHRVDVGLTDLKARIEVMIKVAGWGLTLLAGTLVVSAGSGIWWAATLTAKVGELEKKVDGMTRTVQAGYPVPEPRIVPPPASGPVPTIPPETADPKAPGRGPR